MLCLDGKTRRPRTETIEPEDLRPGDYMAGYGGSVWRVNSVSKTRSGSCKLLISPLGKHWQCATYPRAPKRRFDGWRDRDPANE